MSDKQLIQNISNIDSQKYLYESPSRIIGVLEKIFQSQLFRDVLFYSKLFFITLSIILIFAIILLFIKSKPLERARKAITGTSVKIPKTKVQSAWARIQKRLASKNEAEYKMAVIEADKLLDNILEAMGFKGDMLGEKLKTAKAVQMQHIDGIWEAHKIRNRIVHSPDEKISLSEAEKAIEEFKKGLEELDIL